MLTNEFFVYKMNLKRLWFVDAMPVILNSELFTNYI